MKVLVVGVGRGSWQIRGVQLGRAIGARVTTAPTSADFAWADVIVLVKHALEIWGDQASRSKARLLWDVLDAWTQPDDNGLPMAELVDRISVQCQRFGVHQVIGATRAMAAAIGGAYLPHHSRPGLLPCDIRPTVRVIAYEGTRKYLGSWRPELERTCASLGIAFVVNPPDLRRADLVVAFRGDRHDGTVCREWKSGVKLVNALAAGRPVLTQDGAAMREIQPYGSVVNDPAELVGAIQSWQPADVRQRALIACEARRGQFNLHTVAREYRLILDRVWRQAA